MTNTVPHPATAAVRPAAPIPGRPAAPAPRQRPAWQNLFREAVYADGPYDRGDEDNLEDDA